MPLFFNDAVDDPLAFDACPSFSGGQVSFQRANIIAQNQAQLIENFIISINGEIEKRRGSSTIGGGYVGAQGSRIQGMLNLDTVSDEKLVAFTQGEARWLNGSSWDLFFSAAISDTDEVISPVQLTDKIFWTDSNKGGIRLWDGATVSTIASSPSATFLTAHGVRLVASGLTDVKDAIEFSDLLDGETWDSVNQRLRIGAGDGDPVKCHISWQETGILVFKRSSTWLIDANPQVPVAEFPIKLVHSSIGCVAPKSVAQVGQDIWFLSMSGVQSVQKQLATSNNEITVPVSQPVQDIIRRIRWDHAHKSAAVFHNNQYMLSVPVDGNDPDTVICFNVLTGGWSVISGWSACWFMRQPYEGTFRLLYGTNEGKVREWLDYERSEGAHSYLETMGAIDLPFDLPQDFPDIADFDAILRTRALTFSEPVNPKSGFYAEIEFVTSSVSFDVYAIIDGAPRVLLQSYENLNPIIELPIDLPFDFPESPGWARKRFPLHHLEPFRELQFEIVCTVGKLTLRDITASAFIDTTELRS